MAIESSS